MRSSGTTYAATLFSASDLERRAEFARFRKALFVDRLGWDLVTSEGGEEDDFDREDTDYVTLLRAGELVGGFRAIRCDHPYLSECVFPTLAQVAAYPKRRTSWEISRFGVWPLDDPRERFFAARLNYALMFRFAFLHGATSLVAVADLTYERFLGTVGVRSRRFGPPQAVCADATGRPLVLVAGEIVLADQEGAKFETLVNLVDRMEIEHATPVFGRGAVSA